MTWTKPLLQWGNFKKSAEEPKIMRFETNKGNVMTKGIMLALLSLVAIAGAGLGVQALREHHGAVHESKAPAKGITDLQLYQMIAKRVSEGDGYYQAATSLQRKNDYPVKPFYSVRMPTLAWLMEMTAPKGAWFLLLGMLASTMAAWGLRLRREPLTAACLMIAIGTACSTYMLDPDIAYSHEVWAGLLMALSLALAGGRTWALAAGAGLGAILFREIALPFAFVMMASAIGMKRRTEAWAWVAVILSSAVLITLHAQAVATQVMDGDPTARSFGGLNGPAYAMEAILKAHNLHEGTWPAFGSVVILALLGWASRKDVTHRRVFAVQAGYAVLLAVYAERMNFYWIYMVTPLLMPGIVIGIRPLWDGLRRGGRLAPERELGKL